MRHHHSQRAIFTAAASLCALVALLGQPVLAQPPAESTTTEAEGAPPDPVEEDEARPPEPMDDESVEEKPARMPSAESKTPAKTEAAEPDAAKSVAADPKTTAAAAAEESLAVEQQVLAGRFKEVKRMMLNLAEFSATTDPRRAELLRSAIAQSEEQDVGLQFEALIELLQNDQLALAEKNQTTLKSDLDKLLELLMKEDRTSRIDAEKKRIQNLIKDVGRIIKEQRGVKARTEGGDDLPRLTGDQQKINDKTQKLDEGLEQDIAQRKAAEGGAESEEKSPAEGKSQPGKKEGNEKEDNKKKSDEKQSGEKTKPQPDTKEESKPGEKFPADKPTESDSKDKSGESAKESSPPKEGDSKSGEPKAGESKEGESKEGESKKGQPKEGQPQQGQPSDGQSPDGQPPANQPPPSDDERVKKRIEQARKQMEDAQQKLEQAERAGAAEAQQAALEELEQAKAELEKILRQLREEEVERVLAALEERFRKMLKDQLEVQSGTKRLSEVPTTERGRDDEIEAGKLSRIEAQIVREADRALTVLRDEGTAVAFPEAVGQMRDDMEQVVVRLAQNKPDELTLGIEEDIIAALEELIESLKRAQKELEEQKNQPQQAQSGEPQGQALIDKLAELRMIRALQMRVNNSTQRYSDMIQGEQAEKPDLRKALQRLGDRQQRIHQVTRDIHLGKNQ